MFESLKASIRRNAPVYFGLLVAALIIWPVFDLAIALYITHIAFHYSIAIHVLRPLLFIAVYAIITTLVDLNKKQT